MKVRPRRDRSRWLPLLVFLPALIGCHIESLHPLSGPADTSDDQRLLGTWILHGEREGECSYLHIGTGESAPLHAVWVSHMTSGAMRTVLFAVSPTEIGHRNYASVRIAEPAKEAGYFFVKYSVNGDQLTLWDLDLAPAARRQTLKAGRGMVTDDTYRLRNFVATADPLQLSTGPAFTFERVAARWQQKLR